MGSDSRTCPTHYKLSTAQPSNPETAQFISDSPVGPVFRLTYFVKQPGELALTFEVKMPGKDTFSLMASADGHKQ